DKGIHADIRGADAKGRLLSGCARAQEDHEQETRKSRTKHNAPRSSGGTGWRGTAYQSRGARMKSDIVGVMASTHPRVPVGRLAPTPSGRLHLGNVCAFAAAWLSTRAHAGRMLLRIEDVDRERANDDMEASFRADLLWLGLDWDAETPRQSTRDYAPALA